MLLMLFSQICFPVFHHSSHCGYEFFVRRTCCWHWWSCAEPRRVRNGQLGPVMPVEPAITSKGAQVSLLGFCFSLLLSQRQLQSRLFPKAYAEEELKVPQYKTWASAGWKSAVVWFRKMPVLLLSLEPAVRPELAIASTSLRAGVCISTSESGRMFVFLAGTLKNEEQISSGKTFMWADKSHLLLWGSKKFSVQEGSSCPPGSLSLRATGTTADFFPA